MEEINLLKYYVCATNHRSLIDSIIKYFITHFDTVSLNDEFLNMSCNDLNLLLEEYRKPLQYVQFRNEDILLDALMRWLYRSPEARVEDFKKLCEMINCEEVTNEYLSFLSREYGIQCDSKETLKSYLKNHLSTAFDASTDDHKVLPNAYGSLSSVEDRLKLHIFVQFKVKGDFDGDYSEPLRIVSLNPSRTKWFVSHTEEDYDLGFTRSVAFDEARLLYTYEYYYSKPVFRSYSSIQLRSSVCTELQCPPGARKGVFDMCKKQDGSIYWYNSYVATKSPFVFNTKNYRSSGSRGCGRSTQTTTTSSERGEAYCHIHRYVLDQDMWISLPEMEQHVSGACMTTDSDLLYLIGGRTSNRQHLEYVPAYDQRTSTWLRLPSTNRTYLGAECCTLNGKIYVSDAEVIETYDAVAGKWRVICELAVDDSMPQPAKKLNVDFSYTFRMLSYGNLLWIFAYKNYDYLTMIIDPYRESKSENWFVSSALEETIHKLYELDKKNDESENCCCMDRGYLCQHWRKHPFEPEDPKITDIVVFY